MDIVVELVSGGSVINGTYPLYFFFAVNQLLQHYMFSYQMINSWLVSAKYKLRHLKWLWHLMHLLHSFLVPSHFLAAVFSLDAVFSLANIFTWQWKSDFFYCQSGLYSILFNYLFLLSKLLLKYFLSFFVYYLFWV